ncbi:hypothetical protein INT80_03205 [Gallibacterium anatis]|uniref:Uncharacterized protein n=1 Tax=Gallibacterium anatis TaxID=750 RepID=A0A930UQX1_9PAST|nr:hypothetical protein [Gallibacterium anatis]
MELTESLAVRRGLCVIILRILSTYMLENQDDGTKIGAPIAVRSDFAGGDSTVGVVSVGSYEQTFENLDKIKEHHKRSAPYYSAGRGNCASYEKWYFIRRAKTNSLFCADATQEQINSDSTLSDEDKKKYGTPFRKVGRKLTPNTPYLKLAVSKCSTGFDWF